MSEIELGRGILNVCEGLQFLHNISKKIHMAVAPESVVITATGQWKICNMGLSCAMIANEPSPQAVSPYFLKPVPAGTPRLEPDLAFCAPELSEGGSTPTTIRTITPVADVFSLGMLAYEIFRFNFRLIPEGKLFVATISAAGNNADRHQEGLQALRNLDTSFLSQAIQPLVINMTQTETRFRMTTVDVANNQYFASGALAVLKTIDSLHGRDGGAQAAQLVSFLCILLTLNLRLINPIYDAGILSSAAEHIHA
jgi:SCY1-like protein 2